MDLDLKEKSVIVTGGASNIGRAIVLKFAEEGANITIADLDTEAGERVAALAKKAGAAGVQVVKTDITDLANVEAMFKQAADAYGGVNCLVNNVGWDKLMFFTQTTPDLWEKLIKINYVGNLNCTKVALEYMTPNGGGSIVSISSDASRQGEPREAVYGGLKAATNSFMKTIAKENGRNNIRCNCVCPGVTVPDSTDETSENSMWAVKDAMFTEDQFAAIAKTLPLKRIGKPEDVANAVVFLSSQKVAGYITGQVLSASGGYSMIG
ncbi:MAG: SDR family oxidoreductase [Porticoccaceae bacterium]|nr:SDR family oxidoreductase [Porticoccaceae bacterium]